MKKILQITSDKGLISRIHRELLKLNNNKKILKQAEVLNRHYSKDDTGIPHFTVLLSIELDSYCMFYK